MMRRLFVCTLLFAAILISPVLASDAARDSFLGRLENCLDLYQSQQASFNSLNVLQEGSYSYGGPDSASSSSNYSDILVNFDSQEAAILTVYSDLYADTMEDPYQYATREYYLDGVHYFSAYDTMGMPLEGQYYYETVPFNNLLYWDIRSGMPNYDESGTGIAYLAEILPASCFIQNGDQSICNVSQADFDLVYNQLAERVQAGDTEAEEALRLIYPAFVGYEYSQEDFLWPLNPEACYDCAMKDGEVSSVNSASSSWKIVVDSDSLDTRTVSNRRYVYDSARPEFYDQYHSVVSTSLDARTGQFNKSTESINSGAMEDYASIGQERDEDNAEVQIVPYENQSYSSAIYVYSTSELEIDFPEFNEDNSQSVSDMSIGNTYWYMINN